MKLFGGSGGHSSRSNRTKQATTAQTRATAPQTRTAAPQTRTAAPQTRATAPQTRAAAAPTHAAAPHTAPKPAGKKGVKTKKKLTKKQKRVRILIVVLVMAILVALLAAAAWIFIQPPKPVSNNPTIRDTQNGDRIDINSLLNSGTRIDDVFTFVIGAVDEDETRTDALMVATMDIKQKTINIMNIPRDTMCNNGLRGASRKINAAYGLRDGIEQTKKEIERLMGFRPDRYVIVNFDGIAAIVEAIGGVEYEVPFRMQYDDPTQNLHIDLEAGRQTLNGKQVVEFLRWRHNNDYSVQYPKGDEGRVETQQKFLKEVARQVLSLSNVTNIPKIADAVFKNVKTDLSAGELLWMGMQATRIRNENLKFFTLPGYGQMSTAGSDPTPYSFFFPYYQETLDLVNEYFNPFEEDIAYLDMVSGPESYSGGGSVESGDDERDVWGDTTESDDPEEGEDPEGGSSETENGTTDSGSTTGGETTGGSTSGGESTGSNGTTGSGTTGDTGTTGSESGGTTGTETTPTPPTDLPPQPSVPTPPTDLPPQPPQPPASTPSEGGSSAPSDPES